MRQHRETRPPPSAFDIGGVAGVLRAKWQHNVDGETGRPFVVDDDSAGNDVCGGVHDGREQHRNAALVGQQTYDGWFVNVFGRIVRTVESSPAATVFRTASAANAATGAATDPMQSVHAVGHSGRAGRWYGRHGQRCGAAAKDKAVGDFGDIEIAVD